MAVVSKVFARGVEEEVTYSSRLVGAANEIANKAMRLVHNRVDFMTADEMKRILSKVLGRNVRSSRCW